MKGITRRGFVAGCSAGLAALTASRLSLAGAAGDGSGEHETLVVIFLRGGADGLSIVAPVEGEDRGHYEAARPELALPSSGENALLPLERGFGLHPAAAPLHELYQEGRLAVIHAAGMHAGTRSHFDAQELMELGTPSSRATTTGWITRHLASAPGMPDEILMPALAVSDAQPTSLRGSRETISMDDPDSFDIGTGGWRWRDVQRMALRRIYTSGLGRIHVAGLQALDAMDLIEAYADEDIEPANGAEYPSTSFGRQMALVARIAKLGIGLRVAAVDLGGWDTHESQGSGAGGYFAGQVENLASAMAALYIDLDGGGGDGLNRRLTVVVQSEFGRRFRENGNRGTDHGHGQVMLVLGGAVNGGVHGRWPGLAPETLYDGADLAVATDYRRVLSEILIRRTGNPNLSVVFPGYTGYEPLGIVAGEDLTPV